MHEFPDLGLRSVFDIVTAISREQGTSVLASEQNARKATRVAHNVFVIRNGENVGSGTPEELRSDQRLMASYLGETATLSPGNHAGDALC